MSITAQVIDRVVWSHNPTFWNEQSFLAELIVSILHAHNSSRSILLVFVHDKVVPGRKITSHLLYIVGIISHVKVFSVCFHRFTDEVLMVRVVLYALYLRLCTCVFTGEVLCVYDVFAGVALICVCFLMEHFPTRRSSRFFNWRECFVCGSRSRLLSMEALRRGKALLYEISPDEKDKIPHFFCNGGKLKVGRLISWLF